MCKTAIPTSDREMVASDRQVVGPSHTAIAACSFGIKLPEIVATDAGEESFCTDLRSTRDKDAGGPALVADHLGLASHSFDHLISHLPAIVTICVIFGEDELFPHTGKGWDSPFKNVSQ
jgi:hypothetical protein